MLEELREDLEDAFEEFIDSFFVEGPEQLDQIESAIANGDAASLNHAAHSLKSSSAYVGVVKLAEILYELEKLGKEGSTEGASPLAEAARAELEKARPVLRKFVAGE